MARKPRDIAIGYPDPVIDRETGEQVVHPQKGLKWKIRVELPRRGAKRKRSKRYRTFYGSERQAILETNRFVAEINRDLAMHTIPNQVDADVTNMTFGECVKMWLVANRDNGSIVSRKWECYHGMAHNHIIPSLGHISLRDMSAFHISRYKEIKLQDGQGLRGGRLSPVTVNKHLSLISVVLEDAASPGKRLIPFNPSTMVKRARGGRNRVTAVVNCLNAEQLNDLLGRLSLLYSLRGAPDSVKKKPETIGALKHAGYTDKEMKSPKALHKFKAVMLFPIVYLASVTGMRLSELLALRWADVDFLNRTVRVYESSHYGVKGEPDENPHHVNPTKEGRPKALLDLSAKDIEFLRRYREDQEHRRKRYRGRYVDHGLIFARNNGAHLRNDTVGTEFSSFAKSIGLSVTIHGLRHTHCTLLLEAEVPIAFVSRRVGHQLISTTSDIYAHVDENKGTNLSEVFLQILERNDEAVSDERHGKDRMANRSPGVC